MIGCVFASPTAPGLSRRMICARVNDGGCAGAGEAGKRGGTTAQLKSGAGAALPPPPLLAAQPQTVAPLLDPHSTDVAHLLASLFLAIRQKRSLPRAAPSQSMLRTRICASRVRKKRGRQGPETAMVAERHTQSEGGERSLCGIRAHTHAQYAHVPLCRHASSSKELPTSIDTIFGSCPSSRGRSVRLRLITPGTSSAADDLEIAGPDLPVHCSLILRFSFTIVCRQHCLRNIRCRRLRTQEPEVGTSDFTHSEDLLISHPPVCNHWSVSRPRQQLAVLRCHSVTQWASISITSRWAVLASRVILLSAVCTAEDRPPPLSKVWVPIAFPSGHFSHSPMQQKDSYKSRRPC